MSTQPFDPARYKAGQRREWDAAASGLKYWWQVAEPALQPVSERMMELADIQPGQRVLDVATGIGEPAVTAARRVGPSGHVIATDLSPQMLALGRERVAELGLPPIDFREMDAETLELPGQSFDIILCRFGLMYLPDPQAALERMHIVDPRIQTVKEASVRYKKEHEKTLYSQLQSPGGSRVVQGRQNDCADCCGV